MRLKEFFNSRHQATICNSGVRAYNRTAHLEERRKMMQAWADYLDHIKSESYREENILTFKRR